ncbi:heme/hemin ABC transporter substrate-binding protein [Dermacoccaceae bacterium W4C1]
MRRTAGLLAASLLLAGCAGGEAATSSSGAAAGSQEPLSSIAPVSDPKSITGSSTATLTQRAIDPVEKDPQQKLPSTVPSYDRSGTRQVTVTSTERVVPMDLSGSIAATLWGLGFGDSQVGRDVSTTFPPANKLPLVTVSGHSINSEAVIKLRPTLVITDGSVGPRDVVEQLRKVGIPVVFVRNTASFAGAGDLARQVSKIYGAPATGEKLAARISAEVKQVETQVKRIAPSEPGRKLRMVFLYMRGSSGVYYLFGSESGANLLIESLGGIDVAGELGWGGMRPLTDEAMVKANPDLILVMTDGLKSVGGIEGLKKTKPAVALTKAGRNNRIVDMSDGDVLSFGPRSGQVLEALTRAIYAPKSSGAATGSGG